MIDVSQELLGIQGGPQALGRLGLGGAWHAQPDHRTYYTHTPTSSSSSSSPGETTEPIPLLCLGTEHPYSMLPRFTPPQISCSTLSFRPAIPRPAVHRSSDPTGPPTSAMHVNIVDSCRSPSLSSSLSKPMHQAFPHQAVPCDQDLHDLPPSSLHPWLTSASLSLSSHVSFSFISLEASIT